MLETDPWKINCLDRFYKDYNTYSVYFISYFLISFVVIEPITICSQTNRNTLICMVIQTMLLRKIELYRVITSTRIYGSFRAH